MITLSFIRSGHWISDIRPGVEERYLNTDGIKEISSRAPVVTGMQVLPVAGRDSMLLNLSGAHGPFFTRNIVILKDNAGHTGVSEVPGGERIRMILEESKTLVINKSIGSFNNILNE